MHNFSNSKPLVSIIAICFNHEAFVEETLDSILTQTYRPIELIIIDNFSTDSSVNRINTWISNKFIDEKFSVIFVKNKHNDGLCAALNQGLQLAKGKYFKPISCDDTIDKEFITKTVTHLELTNKEYIAGIFSDAKIIDDSSKIIHFSFIRKHRHFPPPPLMPQKQLVWFLDHHFPVQGVLLKKSVIEKIGGYDPMFLIEDQWLWLKLSMNGYSFEFIDMPLASYRKHINNNHISLSDHLRTSGKVHQEKGKILFNIARLSNRFLYNTIKKRILLNLIKQNQLKNKFYNTKQILSIFLPRGDFFYVFIMILLIWLPGYYWKKRLLINLALN